VTVGHSMTRSTFSVGFIGLGHMGMPIALRLLEAGRPLTVWGRTPSRLEPALAKGAKLTRSAAELAAASDVVLLCVTDSAAVEAVVFGEAGIAAGARANAVLVDHSTIHPGATRSMAARLLMETGVHWVDAPVSGGPPAVARGTLAVMAGGSEEAFMRVSPLIAQYAGRVTHMGAIGAGQTTKLVNQALVGAGFMLLAEALNFARRAGIDVEKVPAAIRGGRADSALLQEYWPRMVAEGSAVSGRIDIILKDLDIVASVAEQAGAAMPLTRLAGELHRLLTAWGLGIQDNTAVTNLYESAGRAPGKDRAGTGQAS
jgi:3-hydroxyisobutyrate dehydrogenase